MNLIMFFTMRFQWIVLFVKVPFSRLLRSPNFNTTITRMKRKIWKTIVLGQILRAKISIATHWYSNVCIEVIKRLRSGGRNIHECFADSSARVEKSDRSCWEEHAKVAIYMLRLPTIMNYRFVHIRNEYFKRNFNW